MRTMYDAVTPENIPRNAQLVAGYIDGHIGVWTPEQWAYFPDATKVKITVFASDNEGHVLDCENGDATPDQCPAWVVKRRQAGADPTVYCNTSSWAAVRAAFAANKVAEPHYWIAAYPGNGPQIYAGAVAHQYADPGPFDLSVVMDYWPGVDPAPAKRKPGVYAPPAYIGYPVWAGHCPTYLATMIQGRLLTLGFGKTAPQLVVDGSFGPDTQKWVVQFQTSKGLARDGVVGPTTWHALFV